jgi:hypothetical protein
MIGVYTCLIGLYDNVLPAKFGGVLFTDQDIAPDGWTIKKVSHPLTDDNLNSRFYFCNSCEVMPDYDITIEHGADVQLQMSPGEIVERFLPDDRDVACFAHPHRTSVYEEGRMCGHWRKDNKEVIKRQMGRYEREGFPGNDLSTCILLIRRNNERIREFEKMWWQEVLKGSRRNQLSFDYCRWKLKLGVARIPGSPYKRGDIMKVQKHLRTVHFD